MFFHNVTYVIYEDIILMSCFQFCKESEKKKKENHLYFLSYALINNRFPHITLLEVSTVPVPTQKHRRKKLF